jgi:Flp pilus assembly pilin Flp
MLKAYVFAQRKLMDLRDNCKGVTAMEYGIIGSVTVVVVGAAVAGLNTPLSTIWTKISTALATAAT